jgi:hypothetical protein
MAATADATARSISSIAYPSRGHGASYHGRELRTDELIHLVHILPGKDVIYRGVKFGRVLSAILDGDGDLILTASLNGEPLPFEDPRLQLMYGVEIDEGSGGTCTAIVDVCVTIKPMRYPRDAELHVHYIKEGDHTIRFRV